MKRKTIAAIVTSIISFDVYAGVWCGSPICPGDIVTDFESISVRTALESAAEEFHEARLMVTQINKFKNDIMLHGNEAQANINRSMMEISKKTESAVNIFNNKTLRDLQPDDSMACNVISLIEESADCDIKNQNSDMMSPSDYTSFFERNKITTFYDNYADKFQLNEPLTSPTLTNKDWISGSERDAAVAAIDILTNEDLHGDKSGLKIDEDTYAGKAQAVSIARRELNNNITRNGLLQGVVDRTGGSDGGVSKIQYLDAGVANFFEGREVELPDESPLPDESSPSPDLPATVQDALLTTIPALRHGNKDEILSCLDKASQKNNVDRNIMLAIMAVEGGVVGTQSPNSNKTFDYGIMQINDITIEDLRKRFNMNYTIEQIRDSACTNIDVSAMVLAQKIKEAGGNVMKGVGDYNSRNEPAHSVYLKKIVNKMAYLANGAVPQSMSDSVSSGEVLTSQMWRRIALMSAMELKIELESFKKWSSVEAKMATVILNEQNSR
ncbi:lytic transglycosylase domain-containing protein [Aeromonas caviae]|uniref:lytic transglycosylase domain-containing protein n=1 Tax=Aeromonas caviae TaxID=648 RepID=UPI00385C8D52